MSVDINKKADLEDKAGWGLTTQTDVFNQDRIIKASGTVKQQINKEWLGAGETKPWKKWDSLKDLQSVRVAMEVQNEAGDKSCAYVLAKGYDGQYLEWQKLDIAYLDGSHRGQIKYDDYDIERHFAWK